jgi:hypothetical protein
VASSLVQLDQDNAGWNIHNLTFAAGDGSGTNLAQDRPVTASTAWKPRSKAKGFIS